jgi:hypothetical protein
VQPRYVQALIADQDQDRSSADGVNGHVAANASGHGLAQRPLPSFLGHSLGQGQPGRGQGSEVVRIDPACVPPDDQAIAAGHRRARNSRYLVLQRSHLGEQRILGHLHPLIA